MKSHTPKTILLLLLLITMLTMPVLAAETRAPSAESRAPVAENLELTTYREVGVIGALVAVDPEGEALEYRIVRAPRKGDLQLDESSGHFSYTPREGKRGRDHFTYVAVDASGNISEEATVRIRIERQSSRVQYTDMTGHPAHFAAVSLAERDIFVGEQIGGRHFFNPDSPVRRGEFLAMSLRLADTELLTDVVRTGFADDYAIADWLRPYVSTAVLDGLISGIRRADGHFVFAPANQITRSEAAVILNNVLGLSDVPVSATLQASLVAPPWAHQATVNLSMRNIISLDPSYVYHETLTRADVAELLLGAAHTLEGRAAPSPSLLRWAA